MKHLASIHIYGEFESLIAMLESMMEKPQIHVDSIEWDRTNQRQKRKARRRLAHLGVKNAHAR